MLNQIYLYRDNCLSLASSFFVMIVSIVINFLVLFEFEYLPSQLLYFCVWHPQLCIWFSCRVLIGCFACCFLFHVQVFIDLEKYDTYFIRAINLCSYFIFALVY